MTEEKFRERFCDEIESQAESLVDGHTNDNEEWGRALDSAYEFISDVWSRHIRIVAKITPLQWELLVKAEAERLKDIAAGGVSLNNIYVTAGDSESFGLEESQSVWSFSFKRGRRSIELRDEAAEATIERCGVKDGPDAVKALEFVPSGFVRDCECHGDFVINLAEEKARQYLAACGFVASKIT